MRFEKFIKATPFVLFFLFVTVPMLSLPRDMWDGTIIEYASLIDDFSGLKTYFFESTWFLQYPLSLAIIEISQILNMSYKNLNALVVLLFMFIFLRETLFLAEHQIKLSKPASYFALALVATFGTWGVLLSSIMTFHLACMAIGLLSVRTIHTKTLSSTLLGLTALLISLSLQSLSAFLPVLSYIYDLSERSQVRQLWFSKPSKQTTLIFGTCIAFYLVIRLFYPPSGLYENYNNLVIGSFEGLAKAAFSSLALGTFLIPIFLIVACLSLLAIVVDNKTINPTNEVNSYNPKWVVWLLILFCAGLFPYAAVGKYTALWAIGDWSSRQAFLLVLPTCLFTALCLQILYDKFSAGLLRTCILTGGAVIFLFHLMLLTIDIEHKSNRQIFVTQLENIMRANEDRLSPGLLEIVGSNLPTPTFRTYEANFLMYSATGKANWFVRVGNNEDENFTISCSLKENQNLNIYNYEPEHANNHTVVEINASGFRGRLKSSWLWRGLTHSVFLVRNLLGINPPGVIELIRIYSKPVVQGLQVENCN
jgi:hypothetical protein